MSTIIEDFSPVYCGDVGSILAPVFQYADDSYVNLTGATISMKMKDRDTGIIKTCNGPWTIDGDPTKGKAHYEYQSEDVDTAGLWELQITITISGKPIHADTRILEIKPIF